MSYDPNHNSKASFDLAVRACREICIRRGQVQPDRGNPLEMRWQAEGEVPNNMLEACRG